jgi:hypothetical protein
MLASRSHVLTEGRGQAMSQVSGASRACVGMCQWVRDVYFTYPILGGSGIGRETPTDDAHSAQKVMYICNVYVCVCVCVRARV